MSMLLLFRAISKTGECMWELKASGDLSNYYRLSHKVQNTTVEIIIIFQFIHFCLKSRIKFFHKSSWLKLAGHGDKETHFVELENFGNMSAFRLIHSTEGLLEADLCCVSYMPPER